jgi:hypothetical protein
VTGPANRERQALFAERIRERGYVKICEWIPAGRRDAFKALAKAWRDGDEPAAQAPDDVAGRVRQAGGWGWTADAIAAYAGIGTQDVKRILGEG